MKYLLFICILFGTIIKIYSQNIISNSGFEQGNFITNYTNEDYYIYGPPDRFLDGINDWECRFWRKIPNKHNHENYQTKWHSPDWFGEVNSQPSYLHNELNYFIYPIEGNKYVGMMDYELIQQKLGTYNELENGISYILKMKVYLSYNKVGDYAYTTSFSNSYLNVYFAKNKVKYRKESGKDNKVCTEKYKKHETGWGQDYIDVEYFDLANYTLGQWITLSTDFYVSNSNADSYNWFVIEIL